MTIRILGFLTAGTCLVTLCVSCSRESFQGDPTHPTEAVDWPTVLERERDSAMQGDALAQTSLSAMYFTGIKVAQDYVEAYAWATLAMDRDPNAAQIRDNVIAVMTPEQVAEGEVRVKQLREQIAARTPTSDESSR